MEPQFSPSRILIVDDDRHVQDILSGYLTDEGYLIERAMTAMQALERVRAKDPDLILLDLRLPDRSGIELFSALREISGAPVIMLTSCAEETDRVLGLELGADDYITKPFSAREVVARVRGVLRRMHLTTSRSQPSRVGELEIDPQEFEVRLRGAPLPLTKTEFRIVRLLASQPGRTFSRAAILDEVCADSDILDRTLDKHITNLRKKLERDPAHPEYILTVYGVGYKMPKQFQPSPSRTQ